jgi:hypothetical protein
MTDACDKDADPKLTSCKNCSVRPSSANLYVRKTPVVHDRGARNVSLAVPTTR